MLLSRNEQFGLFLALNSRTIFAPPVKKIVKTRFLAKFPFPVLLLDFSWYYIFTIFIWGWKDLDVLFCLLLSHICLFRHLW